MKLRQSAGKQTKDLLAFHAAFISRLHLCTTATHGTPLTFQQFKEGHLPVSLHCQPHSDYDFSYCRLKMAHASTDPSEALETEHQALKEQYCAMEEQLGEVLEKIEQLEEKNSQLEETITEQQETIEEQEETIEELDEALEQQAGLLGHGKHSIKQLKERIVCLQAQLRREMVYNHNLIKKQLDGEEVHSDEMIKDLLRARYPNMIEELERATLWEEEAIDQLFEQIPGITQDVMYRETDYYLSGLEESTKYVANLKAAKDALEIECTDLKTAKDELEVENLDLKTAKDELETQMARLQIAGAEHEYSDINPVSSPDTTVQIVGPNTETAGYTATERSRRKKRKLEQNDENENENENENDISDCINIGVYVWNADSGSYGKAIVIPVATAVISNLESLTTIVHTTLTATGMLARKGGIKPRPWMRNAFGQWAPAQLANSVALLDALAKAGGHAGALKDGNDVVVSYLVFPKSAGKKAQTHPAT
jgi:hypothetical protein